MPVDYTTPSDTLGVYSPSVVCDKPHSVSMTVSEPKLCMSSAMVAATRAATKEYISLHNCTHIDHERTKA